MPPNSNKLRCFSCLCYPWLRPYVKHKLAPKSAPCIFVGYSPSQSAYYCLEPTINKVYTSRHVNFVESEFPYSKLTTTTPVTSTTTIFDWCTFSYVPTSTPATSVPPPTSPLPPPSPPASSVSSTSPSTPPSPALSSSASLGLSTTASPAPSSSAPSSPTLSSSIPTAETQTSAPQTTHSDHSPSDSLTTPIPTSPPSPPPPTRRIITRLTNNIVKPNPKYANLATLSDPTALPTTTKQALATPHCVPP